MKKIATKLGLLTALILMLNACKDSPSDPGTEPDPGNEQATLEAVISYSPESPGIGDEITLDASGSKDDQNIGYEIEWALESKPSGSSATISSSTQSDATFLPDISGDYVVSLTITNSSEGISDNAQETISIGSSGKAFVELSGAINSDKTLTNVFDDPAQKDYLVTGDLSVNAKLTVEPGVVIHFQEGLGMTVNANGILVAVGKADSNIVFTGESQAVNGFWRGINIHSNSVENKISHAEISFAGSGSAGSYFEAAALTVDMAKIQLSDVTISHSGGYGIQTRRGGSEFPMENMVFEKNDKDHAFVHLSQLSYFDATSTFDEGYVTAFGGHTIEDMTIVPLDGAKYKIESSVTFDHNVTIDAGTVFEFAADARLYVANGSSIQAEGTADNKIVFTGTAKAPGAWKGIFIASSSVDNIFEHVDISYGGSSAIDTYFSKTNMAIADAKVTLRNVSFTGSAGYGIQTRTGGGVFSLENSSFNNNADHDMRIHPSQVAYIDNQTNFNGGDVEVYNGNTGEGVAVTWSNLNNGRYYFTGSVDITNTVDIEAGAQFEMGADVILKVRGASGVIKAIGTSASPIVFSGRSKAKGAWGGIIITSASVDNVMDYVKIEYGGGRDLDTYVAAGNLGISEGGYLALSNAAIENSANYGIIVTRGGNLEQGSNITYSANANTNLYSN